MLCLMEPIRNQLTSSPWEPGVLALGVFALMAALLVTALLSISGWLGEKKPSAEKSRPYECGIIPTGSAQVRYPVAFYLIATFFLIFDMEAAFIFSWAVAFDRLGWSGWCEILVFVIILFASLLYIWKKGGLEWGPTARQSPATPEILSSPTLTD